MGPNTSVGLASLENNSRVTQGQCFGERRGYGSAWSVPRPLLPDGFGMVQSFTSSDADVCGASVGPCRILTVAERMHLPVCHCSPASPRNCWQWQLGRELQQSSAPCLSRRKTLRGETRELQASDGLGTSKLGVTASPWSMAVVQGH